MNGRPSGCLAGRGQWLPAPLLRIACLVAPSLTTFPLAIILTLQSSEKQVNAVAIKREETPIVLSIRFPHRDMALDVHEGECVALLEDSARSGLALLNALAGKTPFAPGRLYLDGCDVTDVPPAQRRIAWLDDPLPAPVWRSVLGQVLRALGPEPVHRADRYAAASQALQSAGWSGSLHTPLKRLNPDERRLLRLACALAENDRVLLLTSPLDGGMLTWLQQVGMSVMMLVDSLALATAAQRIAVMHAGGMDCVCTPGELAHRPASAYAARRAGQANMLRVRVVARGPGNRLALDLGGLTIPAQAEPPLPPLDTLAWLCVDPACVRVGRRMEGAFHLSAMVEEPQGSALFLRLPGGQRIIAQSAPTEPFRPGDRVCIRWDVSAACVLMDTTWSEEMISC